MGGASPLDKPPLREQTLPRPPQRRPYPHPIQIYP